MTKFSLSILFMFLLSLPQLAAAQTFQIKGSIASFYHTQTEGCNTRTQFVFVAQEASNTGTGNGQSTLFVLDDVYDSCAKVSISNVRGTKKIESYEYALRKSYARVTSALDVIDSVNGTDYYSIVVDLTWIGDGQPIKNRSKYNFEADDFKIIGRSFTTNEAAVVTGFIANKPILVSGNLETTRAGEIIISQ